MPLIESRGASFTFICRDMRRKVKLFMVYTLDLKAGRKAVVIVWQRPASKDMDLRLVRDRGAFRDAEEVNAVVVDEKGIFAVRKTSSLLIRVKTEACVSSPKRN